MEAIIHRDDPFRRSFDVLYLNNVSQGGSIPVPAKVPITLMCPVKYSLGARNASDLRACDFSRFLLLAPRKTPSGRERERRQFSNPVPETADRSRLSGAVSEFVPRDSSSEPPVPISGNEDWHKPFHLPFTFRRIGIFALASFLPSRK